MSARIVVAVSEPERSRFFTPSSWDPVAGLVDVHRVDGITAADSRAYAAAVRNADIVVTAWNCPPLTSEILDAAPDLGLVAHAASSVRRIITDELWRRGLRVTQAGAAMAPAVAEASFVMTLALLRKVPQHLLRGDEPWPADHGTLFGREMSECRVGVVGASRTGRHYIRLVQAFGARVDVYDPYLHDAAELGVRKVELPSLLNSSDVIAVHAPATTDTHQLIGAAELALVTDGGILVNTARAAIIDMDALFAEVASGRISAGLDVHDVEPVPQESAWRGLPNALLTPHLGGKTIQSRRRGGAIVVAEIHRFLTGEPLQHEISADQLEVMG